MRQKSQNTLAKARQAARQGDHTIAVRLLVGLLSDSERNARSIAAEKLGELGWLAAPAIPALIQRFTDSDSSVKKAAVRALGHIGKGHGRDKVMPVLAEALQHEDSDVRSEAIWAMLTIGEEANAIPHILQALQDHVFWVKASAIQVLGKIVQPGGESKEEAITALNDALQDQDNEIRKEANVALKRIKKREQEAGGASDQQDIALLKDLKAPEPVVRINAAEKLGEHIDLANATVPALITALCDSDADVRSAAADSLGDLGFKARPAISGLQKAVRDKDRDVREAATEALKKIRSARS